MAELEGCKKEDRQAAQAKNTIQTIALTVQQYLMRKERLVKTIRRINFTASLMEMTTAL